MGELTSYLGTAGEGVDRTGNELQFPNAAQDRTPRPGGEVNSVGVDEALVAPRNVQTE
ncbi:hypothetical protein Nm8I071_37680 [Nonomuraea sp. TT08I-71]|nr:hypothetical protein Nm8I071_37680 [Nonomuraea sp. TT08I-71]